MGSHYYFVVAAFIVAAAFLKVDVPLVSIALGIGLAGLANYLWSRRRPRRARATVAARR